MPASQFWQTKNGERFRPGKRSCIKQNILIILKINLMKKVSYLLMFLTAGALFLASCSKNGAPGPQGATGPQGPAGAAGTAGATGATGATGTTNVFYSAWTTPATYTKDTVFTTWHLYTDIAASKITQAILDKGAVVVYGKLDGYNTSIWPTDQVSALPILLTYQQGATTYTDTWSSLVTLGNVRIDFANDKNLYNSISNAHQFRYVVIPGATLVAAAKHINLHNYAEVQQAFHLPD
jgi:hypothetical protein